MEDKQNRRHEMFARAQGFGTEHVKDFDSHSLGAQLFTTLGEIVTRLDEHAASQASKDGSAKQGTTSRGQARRALREDLEAINRTARAMADEIVGLNDKFRLPPPGNDHLLLNAGRAAAADAAPFAAQFIAHEMPGDFLDDLNADIAVMEAAMSEQSSGVGQRVEAGAAIDSTIDDGIAAVRKLDAIVKNKYANNAAVLAQWTSASHTERSPHHKAEVPKTASASGTPPTPNRAA